MRGVIWRGALPAIAGGALGFGGALALARTFRALLFEIEPFDPVFAGAAAALAAVVLVAAIDPARRASRVDPACALRNE